MQPYILKLIRVLTKKRYAMILSGLWVLLFAIFSILPVFTVPGNSVDYQFSVYVWQDYLLLILLSGMSALIFTLQIYGMLHNAKVCKSAGTYGNVTGAFAGSTFSALVGTATCASCIAPLVAFLGLGFGAVATILKYQTYIVIISLIAMLFVIRYLLKKIN